MNQVGKLDRKPMSKIMTFSEVAFQQDPSGWYLVNSLLIGKNGHNKIDYRILQ